MGSSATPSSTKLLPRGAPHIPKCRNYLFSPSPSLHNIFLAPASTVLPTSSGSHAPARSLFVRPCEYGGRQALARAGEKHANANSQRHRRVKSPPMCHEGYRALWVPLNPCSVRPADVHKTTRRALTHSMIKRIHAWSADPSNHIYWREKATECLRKALATALQPACGANAMGRRKER